MSKFQTNQKIAERLKELADQLSSSKLQEQELSEFETLARELYERAVVLNYKAKEALVYGNSSEKEAEKPSQPVHQTKEHHAVEEVEEPEDSDEQIPQEEPSGEIQFDFSSEEESEEVEAQSEPAKEEKPNDPVEEETTSTLKEQDHTEDLEKEDVVTAAEEPKTTGSGGGSQELNDAFEDDKVQSFYEQFEKVHNASLGDRLGAGKLNTLKGAIGLNDKLQFISELFNGDSEAFNTSIDTLDKQDSNENARKLLSQIASKQSWDEENPLVEEFARLIERRYVEE